MSEGTEEMSVRAELKRILKIFERNMSPEQKLLAAEMKIKMQEEMIERAERHLNHELHQTELLEAKILRLEKENRELWGKIRHEQ